MTSFGINNQGYLRFDYYHEDYGNNSVLEQTDVYNGKDSVLWINFAEAFQDRIATTYALWRSGTDPLLSYDKIINNFITKHSDQWSISIYNEDAEYKYISMYRSDGNADNLYQVRGTGEEHLKYFIKNRLMYCDSKWAAGDFTNKDTNTIRLRINAPQITGNLAPNPLLKYKTFSNMYAGISSGAKEGISASKYVTTNDWAEFELTVTNGQNNLDVYIFGASEISEIEDMSLLYCDLITISAASKLTRLIVGNDDPDYRNDNLKTLSFTNNRLLREVNVCNCKGLATMLDFSLCPDIQKIYATGSGITGVVLPSSGFLKEITLPKVDSLIITNQNRINKFECEGYENLTTLRIENSTMVIVKGNDEIESTDRFPLQEILLGCDIDLLRSVNIKDVKWNVDSEENLHTIIHKLIQKQGFVLEGSVYVLNGATISDDLKVLIHQNFPKLNVIDNDPIFYVDYYNHDGTLYATEPVRQGHSAKGPSKNPSDIIMDDQGERHLFVEWNNLPTNVQQNCSVNAKWQTKYAVSFYNEDGTTRYYRGWYNVDEVPADPVVLGQINEPTKASGAPDSLKYKFTGWATSPNSAEPLSTLPVITGVTDFYATFIEQYPVRFYKTSRKETPAVLYGDVQWVINGQDAILPADPTKASTDQYSYKFSGWDGKHTEIKGATNIYANYTPQERTYTVHFYNDTQWLHTATNISYTRTLKPEDLYDYEDIKKEINGVPSDDYDCKGWLSKLISEESIVNCYAVFRYNAYIEQSWQTIINDANSKSVDELKELYPIGARKKVTFTAENGDIVESMDIKWTSNNKTTTYTDVTIDMEVIAYQHDDLADNPGKKASLTFFCKDLPNITMNRYDTGNTYHGWGESSIRDFLNNTLYSYFSDELKSTNGIKSVIKQSDDGNLKQSKLATTSDKCWVASTSEIGFDTLGSKVVQGQGTLYSETFSADSIDAGKARASRQKLSPDGVNCGSWHTRTTYLTDTGMYYTVQSSGASYEQGAWANCYVAFGFCI